MCHYYRNDDNDDDDDYDNEVMLPIRNDGDGSRDGRSTLAAVAAAVACDNTMFRRL